MPHCSASAFGSVICSLPVTLAIDLTVAPAQDVVKDMSLTLTVPVDYPDIDAFLERLDKAWRHRRPRPRQSVFQSPTHQLFNNAIPRNDARALLTGFAERLGARAVVV